MECTLYLSDDCNLRCKYCYERGRRINGRMSEANLQKAIAFIIDNSDIGERIDLTFLGGEPLLNKDMMYRAMEIINEEYKKYAPYIFCNITTNGTMISEKDILFFRNNNFEVSISIDGDHKTHDLNRISLDGKDNYDLIISNMKKMLELQINLSVRMTATQNNVHLLYGNVKYFYDLGIKQINIGIDEVGKWTEKELSLFDESLELLDKYYLDSVVKDEGKVLNIYDHRLASYVFKKKPRYCSGGTNGHLVINSKGEFYPCGYVANDAAWKVGDLENGHDMKIFLKKARESIHKQSDCRDCEIAYTCCGSKCGFLNYALTGYLNGHSDITCKLQKLLHKHNLIVIKKLYETQNSRLMNMLNKAHEHNLELGPVMKQIICT